MSPLGAARALITAGGGVVDQGKLELIETQTITSSTAQVDFTDLGTGYNVHLITLNNFHPATDSQDLNFRVFVGGSLQTGSNDYGRAIPEIGAFFNEVANGYFYLYNALSNSKYTFLNQHSTYITKDPHYATTFGAGAFFHTDTLSGFRFYMGSGNINEAEISLYGIAES